MRVVVGDSDGELELSAFPQALFLSEINKQLKLHDLIWIREIYLSVTWQVKFSNLLLQTDLSWRFLYSSSCGYCRAVFLLLSLLLFFLFFSLVLAFEQINHISFDIKLIFIIIIDHHYLNMNINLKLSQSMHLGTIFILI